MEASLRQRKLGVQKNFHYFFIACSRTFLHTGSMTNKEYQEILQTYNHRLIRIDTRKEFLADIIEDFQHSYQTLCDDWDESWREKQEFINRHEGKIEA
jgi:hypothetical protein